MSETLHIITPVTRSENLVSIYRSIDSSLGSKELALNWWIVIDTLRCPSHQTADFGDFLKRKFDVHYLSHTEGEEPTYGGPQRSRALDEILDGWVTFIDDDSILHPQYILEIWPFLKKGVPKVYLYGQEFRNGGKKWFELDDVCRHVEHSMITVHRSLIGSIRQVAAYDCDKQFVRALYKAHAGDFVIIPQILAYYNWLRDDGWSWNK